MSYLTPKWLAEQGWGDCTKTACPFWAPDLPSNGVLQKGASDDFVMYYSVPELQLKTNKACVGRATGTFNPPSHTNSNGTSTGVASITWTDAGSPVVCSDQSDLDNNGPHAIDPSVGIALFSFQKLISCLL